jgi:hypothetical protein
VAVCQATNHQYQPQIVPDGSGGAIMVWYDYRTSDSNIYAQRVNGSGVTQWAIDGVGICTAVQQQNSPRLIPHSSGGAIITWYDSRNGTSQIYAQRVDTAGVAQWTADGVAIAAHTGGQLDPDIASDEAGGAIVIWRDYRYFNNDVYAQRIDASGGSLWAATGVPVCVVSESQEWPRIAADGSGGAIISWMDYRAADRDIFAQAMDSKGNWGYATPVIHSALDVPGDQGGFVNLAWHASQFDPNPNQTITEYTLWRALSTAQAAALKAQGATMVEGAAGLGDLDLTAEAPVIRIERTGAVAYFWELIDSHVAYHLYAYSKGVATDFDSTAVCDDYHYFQVIAHTSAPYEFYASDPDSGYSVDNLPPCAPQALSGEQYQSPEGIELSWRLNIDSDFSHYHVYRGGDAGFTPDPGNRIGAPPDTTLFDGDWGWDNQYWYKVAAVDIHGNESAFAVLGPDLVTGADDRTPAMTYLAQNHPNPFNPATTIRFGLGEPAWVTLRIYDASGRPVRTLIDRGHGAGEHEILWDGNDDAGSRVTSGVYFCKLVAGEKTITRKMLLLK